MPTREPELYKDKIEVSLDGRQIFYLFFGSAVVVGLVFVLGVMIGRRVEARGHLDRADTQAARDPLAALDRLERADNLSFRSTLTGGAAPTDVEKAIGEIERKRGASAVDRKAPAGAPAKAEAKVDEKRAEAKPEKAEARTDEKRAEAKPEKAEARTDEKRAEAKAEKPDAKAEKPDARAEKPEKAEARIELRPDKPEKPDAKPEKADARPEAKRSDGKSEKADGKSEKADGKSEKADGKSEKPVTRSDAKAEAPGDADGKPEPRAAEKVRFTLQLSSFQDRAEAEAFLATTRSSGFQAYLIEADVGGRGTFYRVRLGSYRSLDAANDAKADYEKSSHKTAQVMRL